MPAGAEGADLEGKCTSVWGGWAGSTVRIRLSVEVTVTLTVRIEDNHYCNTLEGAATAFGPLQDCLPPPYSVAASVARRARHLPPPPVTRDRIAPHRVRHPELTPSNRAYYNNTIRPLIERVREAALRDGAPLV